MDGHGIPIVTSNGAGYSKSIFKIPPCIYSIESPESKQFDDNYDNDDYAVHIDVDGYVKGSESLNSSGGKNDTLPNNVFTRPIPFQSQFQSNSFSSLNSNGANTTTGTMMNAIGHDGNKKWDAILSVRYYDIIQRQRLDVQKTATSTEEESKSQMKMLSIQTTITTVADIQIQIVPTSKPFSSKMNMVTNIQNGCQRDESLSVSHYNHSITLYAKSFTNEYAYENNENEVQNFKDSANSIQQENTSSAGLSTDEMVSKAMTMEAVEMEQYKVENPTYSWSDVLPQVMFSSNENKYITCVIPHPIRLPANDADFPTSNRSTPSLSSTVIFSLDWKTKKRGTNTRNGIGNTSSTTTNIKSINGPSSPAKMTNEMKDEDTSVKTNTVVDDIPTSKIPLPFYIESRMEEGEDDLVVVEKKDGQDRARSLPLPQTVTNLDGDMSGGNNAISTATTGSSPSAVGSTDDTTTTSTSTTTTTTTHSPIIHSPRVVSIETLNSNRFDSGTDDDIMTYQKATKLLTQITTICDINLPSAVATSFEESTSRSMKKNKKWSVHPLLLAGCTNGSILLIGYKRAKLLTLLYDNDNHTPEGTDQEEEGEDGMYINNLQSSSTLSISNSTNSATWNCDECGINQMMYMYSPQQKLQNGENKDREGMGRGRLINIQRNGQAMFFETEFHTRLNAHERQKAQGYPKHHVSINPLGFMLNQREEKLPLIHGTFLDRNTIAFLVHPFISLKNNRSRNDTIVQIWNIDKCYQGHENANPTILMSELKLNNEKLLDFNHGFLPMRSNSSADVHYDDEANDDMLYSRFNSDSQRSTSVRHLRANLRLEYEQFTNSLIVNSIVSNNTSSSFRTNPANDQLVYNGTNIFVRPFVSIWKWRTSTLGFTLLGESFMKYVSKCIDEDHDDDTKCHGRPYLMNDWEMIKNEKRSYSHQNVCLSHDASRGLTLVCTNEDDDGIFQKELYSVGLLSPSPSNSCPLINNVDQPCPIFLSHDSVSYLESLPASVTKEMAVQWKQSQVPSSYISGNGSLRVACMGKKYGRSIAVAASRGFCVLDLSVGRDESIYSIAENDGGFPSPCTIGFECFAQGSSSGVGINHPKWRMFGKSDESSFAVQSMAWWERCNETSKSSEDIILAAIQYLGDGNQHFYFAGWSRRRLGMDNLQILHPCGSSMDEKRKGIKLPCGFVPDSISIVCEPTQNSRRAIALLTSKCNDGIKFIMCQLQVKDDDDAAQGNNGFDVLGRVNFQDTFYDYSLPQSVASSISTNRICSIFIAGAAFFFTIENNDIVDNEESTATLGVLHNLGQSLSSLKVSSSKKTCFKNVFNTGKKSDKSGAINVIEKIWISDDVTKYEEGYTVHTANWSFLLSDGGNMIWSVPFNCIHHDPDGNQPEVIGPLQIFPEDTEMSKIFLGPLPTYSDKFLIYSAQDRRKIHYNTPLSPGDISIFGMTDCIVGAPSYTPSLIAQLSERSVKRREKKRRNPIDSFKRRRFLDSTTMATRVIVSYVTDQLHHLNSVRSIDRLAFYERMLADIVGLTKSSLSSVQFAYIFLSIARQLEHYHLDHLLPLPLQSDTTLTYITVKDLFDVSVKKRTLPVASSSLPIFKTTEVLHEYCLNLLHHCITVIFNFVSARGSADLWFLREECFFLQQIYNYTVKLEDSFEAQQFHYEDSFESVDFINDEPSTSLNSNADFGIDDSNIADDSEESDSSVSYESTSSVETAASYADIKVINTTTPSRMRRIASALKPLFLISSKIRKDDEHAIAEAASTFVTSGFKGRSLDVSRFPNGGNISSVGSTSIVQDNSFSAEDVTDLSTSDSVIEIISKAIISSIFFGRGVAEETESGRQWNGLNRIAVLCNLLQCQNKDRDYEIEKTMEVIELISEDACITSLKAWKEASEKASVLHDYDEDEDEDEDEYENDSKDDNYSQAEDGDIGSWLMAQVIQLCQTQWSFDDARSIFDVLISVLARYKTAANDVDAVLPFLTLIAIISSHISEQSEILFGQSAEPFECEVLYFRSKGLI